MALFWARIIRDRDNFCDFYHIYYFIYLDGAHQRDGRHASCGEGHSASATGRLRPPKADDVQGRSRAGDSLENWMWSYWLFQMISFNLVCSSFGSMTLLTRTHSRSRSIGWTWRRTRWTWSSCRASTTIGWGERWGRFVSPSSFHFVLFCLTLTADLRCHCTVIVIYFFQDADRNYKMKRRPGQKLFDLEKIRWVSRGWGSDWNLWKRTGRQRESIKRCKVDMTIECDLWLLSLDQGDWRWGDARRRLPHLRGQSLPPRISVQELPDGRDCKHISVFFTMSMRMAMAVHFEFVDTNREQ